MIIESMIAENVIVKYQFKKVIMKDKIKEKTSVNMIELLSLGKIENEVPDGEIALENSNSKSEDEEDLEREKYNKEA